ncbi:mitochondrial carrier [Fistulina hepatica ATCC 64428]|uniref:Mitochondrial carrier n=1 Tax=Fistulina hepatica ATCC 64428 TaxID=1128425 RepID=A0A0D7AG56_9AGAR|nr:mitochondrial carrier [Fistulina hepatica ATCC 64428]
MAGQPGSLSTTEAFLCGGLAACIALQGELAKGGGIRVYNNVFDVFKKTWTNEGIRGLQRGLPPAILLNGSRMGFYEPFRHATNSAIGRAPSDQIPITSVFAGASSGAVGAALGSPLFLVKARMQAYSPALPVGTQHKYRSSLEALTTIFRAEGVRGLYRGIDAAILRTAMGSSVQLPSYNFTKRQLADHDILAADSKWTFLLSSTVSGICVALTRMYNQPTKLGSNGKYVGVLYKNPIDCLWKTFRTEGLRGWYKGSTAHFFRIAPHTIVTLTMNDIIGNFYRKTKAIASHDT